MDKKALLSDLVLLLEGLVAVELLCDALGWDQCFPALMCALILAYLSKLASGSSGISKS